MRAAIDLADSGGIDALSMRKLGQSLGVEAMSLYNHAANKDEILDGIVDSVIGEIEVISGDGDWTTQMRRQVLMARQVLLRHPWAPRVIESRPDAGPATLRYMESVIAILREGGLSVDMTHHAIHVLGSRLLGFTQELFDEMGESGPSSEVTAIMARQMADTLPYMTELALAVSHEGGLGGCDDDVEFAFALDLILDGLERLRATS
ncbi:MAG: TetR/AcrR family transcriptional regulator [Candidatus Limnocylindrales bacterium]